MSREGLCVIICFKWIELNIECIQLCGVDTETFVSRAVWVHGHLGEQVGLLPAEPVGSFRGI